MSVLIYLKISSLRRYFYEIFVVFDYCDYLASSFSLRLSLSKSDSMCRLYCSLYKWTPPKGFGRFMPPLVTD